ncbi:MAG: SAM-dependent methyltransferase, partial [Eubacterium sp.]|nr:SAM-dependent methyltransferase [Eubacterium sp.]
MSDSVKLSPRFAACASLVREGKRLADVGCDHGYVPVSLVL